MKIHAHKLNVISSDWGDTDDDFYVQAHCELKDETSNGGEAIILYAVGIKRLTKMVQSTSDDVTFRPNYLIMNDYNEKHILDFINKKICSLKTGTWEDLRSSLSHNFEWI